MSSKSSKIISTLFHSSHALHSNSQTKKHPNQIPKILFSPRISVQTLNRQPHKSKLINQTHENWANYTNYSPFKSLHEQRARNYIRNINYEQKIIHSFHSSHSKCQITDNEPINPIIDSSIYYTYDSPSHNFSKSQLTIQTPRSKQAENNQTSNLPTLISQFTIKISNDKQRINQPNPRFLHLYPYNTLIHQARKSQLTVQATQSKRTANNLTSNTRQSIHNATERERERRTNLQENGSFLEKTVGKRDRRGSAPSPGLETPPAGATGEADGSRIPARVNAIVVPRK